MEGIASSEYVKFEIFFILQPASWSRLQIFDLSTQLIQIVCLTCLIKISKLKH